jgi:tetratricopeptide (TPR) repeat protein
MIKKYLFFAFCILPMALFGQKAKISVESREILTYPYGDPNPIPIMVQGKDKIPPYHIFDGYSLTGKKQKWDLIKLENDYIEVWVMPTDGGKIWGAIEKSTGKEFIYRNEVKKYRNIAMRGPWTSGGIEFNFGYIGHHPSTTSPVDYKIVENSDGSVSCFVGSLDLTSRTKWYVEVRVPKDKAYFETSAMWNNPTPLPQSYYHWMNAAAAVSDDLEFIYPGNQEVEHSGEVKPWPEVTKGRDRSMYVNNDFGSSSSFHVVGEYNDFIGGYYHNSKFGFGHWALYDEMPGHKLFFWSLARDGEIWKDLLTDTDGQYMEFQTGRMFNQYSPHGLKTPITQVPFTPGITDRWNEKWFPVKEIGGMVDVSPMGVMNVETGNGKLEVGINALAIAKAKLIVKSEGNVILSEDINLKPMDVYKTSVLLKEGSDFDVKVEGMDLQYNPAKRRLIKRPFHSNMPTNLTTAASVYQEGMELKENRDYKGAKVLLKECLKMDPLYIDAMVSLTEIYYRSIQYDSALYYANNALQLDTYSPEANYFAGITYQAQGDMINALESMGWAARSPKYRSTAYAIMASIELRLGNNDMTEHYANLALDYDRNNFNALKVLAVLSRKLGKTVLADNYIQTISSLDPLSHFADFERNLLHPSSENNMRFISTITNEMPYQTFLELSLVYFNMGQKNDALAVLKLSPVHPLILLWKAYIKDDASLLDGIVSSSPAFVFPYRTETISALTWALSKNNNWKFKYYMALNYSAIQRDKDALQMLMACGQEPDYAPFYLTRAFLIRAKDDKQELIDLQRAYQLAPDDWRAVNDLITYYDVHQNYNMSLSLSTAASKKHRGNYTIGVQYAIAQINNGQYAKSLKTLDGLNILPFEGASQGQIVFEQACLFLSMDLITKKKYGDALKMIEKSKEWPENLGVGKPYIVDIRVQDYLKAYCLEKLKRVDEAGILRKSITDYTNEYYMAPSFNHILSLWTLQENGETAAANALIEKIGKSKRASNPMQQWVIAKSTNNKSEINTLEKKFSKNAKFLILKKLTELTDK